ncbi:MAG: hypothetical protein IJD70_07605 [Clostridia bacterium]|nr:hypothetical protein [Clostridia bacterium]
MRSIKILSTILSILLIAVCFASCGGGGDIVLPDESDEVTTGSSQTNAYAFVYKSTNVIPHTKMSEVLSGIGEPTSYEESNSCYYQGLDKDYTYPGFKLRTYPVDGVDYVLNVCFTDDSVTTPEGIMLGSTRDEVIAAYGSSFTEENGNTIYTKGKTELRFRFSENGVTAIEYWAIEN